MDPLAQLKDIHLPEQIHNYPIAPGWWLLLAALVIVFVICVRLFLRYRQIRQVKNTLITQVKHSTSIEETLTLLKIALISYFPRQETASLHSNQLRDFLSQQLNAKKSAEFNTLIGESLHLCYSPNAEINAEQFNQAITFWLINALPPKQNSSNTLGGRDD